MQDNVSFESIKKLDKKKINNKNKKLNKHDNKKMKKIN